MEKGILEELYRYCMKKGLRFSFMEDNFSISVMFTSDKSKKIFSYCWNKEENKLLYVHVDGVYYVDVYEALRDFDDYDVLAS